jgi:hypothetical protein
MNKAETKIRNYVEDYLKIKNVEMGAFNVNIRTKNSKKVYIITILDDSCGTFKEISIPKIYLPKLYKGIRIFKGVEMCKLSNRCKEKEKITELDTVYNIILDLVVNLDKKRNLH